MDLARAARETFAQLEGSNAVVAMSCHRARPAGDGRLGNAGGITLGVGDADMFIASDIPAILEYTRDMVFLENRQMASSPGTASRLRHSGASRLQCDRPSDRLGSGECGQG
jgi:glucosamine 6-phosphate synthetase-like amidotransferase/phosphosugar isomerase protein